MILALSLVIRPAERARADSAAESVPQAGSQTASVQSAPDNLRLSRGSAGIEMSDSERDKLVRWVKQGMTAPAED